MCYCVRQDAPRAAAVAAVAAMDVLASCPEPPSTESENALRSRLQLLQQCSARCEACGRLEDEQGDLMLLCDGCLRAGYHQYALPVLSHKLVFRIDTQHLARARFCLDPPEEVPEGEWLCPRCR